MKALSLTLTLLVFGSAGAGCGRSSPTTAAPVITFVVPDGHPADAFVAVDGVPSHYLPARSEVTEEQWSSILRVTVDRDGDRQAVSAASALPAIVGSYRLAGNRIVFKPMFGFDAGLRYRVVFDGARLPASQDVWRPAQVVAVVGLPRKALQPSTMVDRIYPSAAIVPENQLRLYVHFTAPMGRKGGLDFVRLLGGDGREVKQSFLPLEAEFWNADRTRYTVFFDPGRVKRGILPNEQMGRPLQSGRRYTLVIDREWPDGDGLPLKEGLRRSFRAGPADLRPLDIRTWRLSHPIVGSRDPFIVIFPEPLDQGLLMRALGVETAAGAMVSGAVATAAAETQWAFTPASPWAAGSYRLVVLTILEDLAGNRIGRAFEVDQFEQVDRQSEPERLTVPFEIGQE